MPASWEKFSNNYKRSLRSAANLALELNQDWVNPEHVLYGLIVQRGSVGAELFNSLKIKPEEIKNSIAQIGQQKQQITAKNLPQFSVGTKKLIQKSVQIAYLNQHKYIGTEHLLAAIFQINDPEVKQIMGDLKISEADLNQQIVSVLKSASKLPDITETFRLAPKINSPVSDHRENQPAKESILYVFGTNLTSNQIQSNIDPVIGRDQEIQRIIEILCRRTKNNPIILGDPGVGKTAIVEGLAKKIILGEVPEVLRRKKIYTLDLTATVAGAIYRGEFENRLKMIMEEVKNRPEIIIFIDEIHNLVGSGAASGSTDAANILKPALARGEIRCIGATTFGDYRKSIENDPALDRRFQPVKISEPSAEAAKQILIGIRQNFESFHRVKISDAAIEAAVDLSQKYLPEKFLPDKAIDLIDEASSAVKVSRPLSSWQQKIKILEEQRQEIIRQKQLAIDQENFITAQELKKQGQVILTELENFKNRPNNKNELNGEVTQLEIARVVSRMTGVPAENLLSSEKKQLLNLDKKISAQVIGQEPAIATIVDLIQRAKAGLGHDNKPLASFLFVGPSGVGKTYLARVLTQKFFGSPDALVKIDMSEYSEKFNISKLIGAPAGYVGYKESGQLTEKIKHKPYSLVLFDEIEKANPEVFDLLLQILDDGYLTDASGTRINFRHTMIIMTSNLGSHYFKPNKNIGFQEKSPGQDNQSLEEKIITEAKNYFKTELINRLDKIVYFNPLALEQLQKIVQLELKNLKQRLARQNIGLTFEAAVVKLIAQKSQLENQGARAIKRIIQTLIETPLSRQLLAEAIRPGDTVRLSEKNGIINLNHAHRHPTTSFSRTRT